MANYPTASGLYTTTPIPSQQLPLLKDQGSMAPSCRSNSSLYSLALAIPAAQVWTPLPNTRGEKWYVQCYWCYCLSVSCFFFNCRCWMKGYLQSERHWKAMLVHWPSISCSWFRETYLGAFENSTTEKPWNVLKCKYPYTHVHIRECMSPPRLRHAQRRTIKSGSCSSHSDGPKASNMTMAWALQGEAECWNNSSFN